MGWLRDYMLAAEPPLTSFGQLADAALAHSSWPEGTQPKPRSLATLFSKLDRSQQLDWLRDRVAVQQVLAELLNRPLGDLRQSMGEVPFQSGNERFLRLDDIRFAREIDCSREPLPPGIPRAACDPPSWGPTWWTAGPGAGKSITGLWLKCRGLAHVSSIATRSDLEKLPSRGPLYLELSQDFLASETPLTQADLQKLRGGSRPLCIASPHPPTADLPVEHLESAPVEDYLPELVDWVAAHLDGTGHFQPDRAEQWMLRVALPTGAARSLGDALGLLGMLDEVHPRTTLAKSLDDLGEHFVTRRMKEASEDAAVHPRLAQEAYPALLDCAARCLLEAEHRLDGTYSLDEWTALLSSPKREDLPDPDWFTSALSGALGHQVARKDLKRAAQKLQPSAFALAKCLGSARLLVRTSLAPPSSSEGISRRLRPRWLVSLVTARAATTLLSYPSLDWGRVLLSGTHADTVVVALLNAAHRGNFSPYVQLLEDFDPDLKESVAALEGATIAAGLVRLAGVDLPDEILEGLIAHNAETMMVLGGVWYARTTRTLDQGGLFTDAHFNLALCSLCRDNKLPFEHLDPFRTNNKKLPAFCLEIMARVISHTSSSLKKSPRGQPQQGLARDQLPGMLDLMSDMFECCRALDPQLSTAPSILMSVEAWTPLTFQEAIAQCPLSVLLSYHERKNQDASSTARKLWEFLVEDEDPSRYFDDLDLLRKFWGNIQTSHLVRRVERQLSVDWAHILPHQYALCLTSTDSFVLPEQAAALCPLDAVQRALSERGTSSFSSATLRTLLGRAPARFAPLLVQYLSQPSDLKRLLDACPRAATFAFALSVPDAHEVLKYPPLVVDEVRLFLKRAVAERHPDFEQCYAKLEDIERGLWPLRKVP